jgi:hypothetical protein
MTRAFAAAAYAYWPLDAGTAEPWLAYASELSRLGKARTDELAIVALENAVITGSCEVIHHDRRDDLISIRAIAAHLGPHAAELAALDRQGCLARKRRAAR